MVVDNRSGSSPIVEGEEEATFRDGGREGGGWASPVSVLPVEGRPHLVAMLGGVDRTAASRDYQRRRYNRPPSPVSFFSSSCLLL